MKKTMMLILAYGLLASAPSLAQSDLQTPYPKAVAADSGQLEQDRQTLAADRAAIEQDRRGHSASLGEDEARLRRDMAAYHQDSNGAADHMNGQQTMTTYTSRTYYPY